MKEQFLIYLWAIVPNLQEAFVGIIGTSIVLTVLSIVFQVMTIEDLDLGASYKYMHNIAKTTSKICIPLLFVTIFLSILLPSKQDLALIWAYPYVKSGAEKTIKSETVKKLLNVTNLYLDNQIKELKNNE